MDPLGGFQYSGAVAHPESQLRRVLGPGAITVYAVGDILGAGIYALVGTVVAAAGAGAWLSFTISAAIALLTGLTYAELSSRFPHAAGAAAYCRRAYRPPVVAFVVGILVLASGISSAAAVSRAFVGYLDVFVVLPPELASLILLTAMALINFRGIQESARVNLVLTIVELGGLLLVIGAGLAVARHLPAAEMAVRLTPPADLAGILTGATIAFYAYIGFEDTVNVAEEVRDPSRVLPRAILTAIAVSCVLYTAVTTIALLAVPLATLSNSTTPLLDVLNAAGVRLPAGTFTIIALFAICNTGLLNLIMASRLSYGMAREGLLPHVLAGVHAGRQTPAAAILMTYALAVLLAVSGGVRILAQTTSLLLLMVFTTLHVALIVIRRAQPEGGEGVFRSPRWTPPLGALVCAAMIFNFPADVYVRAAVVIAIALLLYATIGRRALAHGA